MLLPNIIDKGLLTPLMGFGGFTVHMQNSARSHGVVGKTRSSATTPLATVTVRHSRIVSVSSGLAFAPTIRWSIG
jgi:hypothetical protein